MSKEAARFAAILKGWGPTLQRAVVKAKRIPGDGDGDGIPYESRNRKGHGYNAAAEQARGEKAMAHVLATHTDVHEAMTTPSGRKVTLLWGRDDGNGKGYGIAHVVADRSDHGIHVAQAIPAVLAHGTESAPHHPKGLNTPGVNPRVNVDYNGVRVTLVHEKHGDNSQWVLTAFEVTDVKKARWSRCPTVCSKSAEGLRNGGLTFSPSIGSGTDQNIDLPLSLLKANTSRWPAGTPGGRGGEFMPGHGGAGGGAVRANGRAHPAPLDTSRFSQAHPAVPRINRRMQQMDDMAAAGNLDFIRTMRTSRGNSYEATVDTYRNQLLAHFGVQARQAVQTGTLPSPPPLPPVPEHVAAPVAPPAPARSSGSLRETAPAAPQLTGRNMNNSALLSAQRHINRLQDIAQHSDNPLEDLHRLSIGASRTNIYLSRAQGYHAALVAHFSQGERAADAPQAPAAARAPVQGQDARGPAAAAAPAAAPAPAAPRAPRAPRGALARAQAAQAAEAVRAAQPTTDPALASRLAVNAMNYRGSGRRLAYMSAFRATAAGEPVREYPSAIRRNAAAAGAEHARQWMALRGQAAPTPVPAPAPAPAPAVQIVTPTPTTGRPVVHTGEGGVQYHAAQGPATAPQRCLLWRWPHPQLHVQRQWAHHDG